MLGEFALADAPGSGAAASRGWQAAAGCVALLLVGIAVVLQWHAIQLRDELARVQAAEQSERAAIQSARQRLWDAYLSEAAAQ